MTELRLGMGEALSSMSDLSDDLRELFRKRAESWASRLEDETKAVEVVSLLHFKAGSEYFALDIKELLRVIPCPKCATTPDAPKPFLGVIGVSGEIWTIIDIKTALRLDEPDQEDRRGYALLLRDAKRRIGLRADALGDVRSFPADQITSLSSRQTDRYPHFTKGMTPSGIALLKAESFLTLSL